jgi:hypothetical protein
MSGLFNLLEWGLWLGNIYNSINLTLVFSLIFNKHQTYTTKNTEAVLKDFVRLDKSGRRVRKFAAEPQKCLKAKRLAK